MNPHEKKLRSICAERCAGFGDPPCTELDIWKTDAPGFCEDCRRDAGEDVDSDPQPLDPAAVLRPLL